MKKLVFFLILAYFGSCLEAVNLPVQLEYVVYRP